MRILISGATGFIGANLVRKLLEEKCGEISVIARIQSDQWRLADVKEELCSSHDVDLADQSAVEEMIATVKPDIIYHVATYGGFSDQVDQRKMMAVNLQGTVNLLDAAVAGGVKRFINTGSSSEYGVKDVPMREDMLCEPVNFYGITKLAATQYCMMTGRSRNYPACTLRLFSPYGPLEAASRLYASIVSALEQGRSPQLSRPESVRDFIPVEMVTDVYLRMMTASFRPGEVINVGSGRQQTIAEFYRMVAARYGSSLEPIWGKAASRAVEPSRWEADISRLNELMERQE